MALVIFSLVGVALGIGFIIYFRNFPVEHWGVNEAERRLIADGDDEISPKGAEVKHRGRLTPRSVANLFFLIVCLGTSGFADTVFSTWVPYFLIVEHKLDFAQMGFLGLLPLLGGALGGIVGGYLNDWMISVTKNRRWSRSAVGLTGKGIGAVLIMAALAVYDSPVTFCWILFCVKFFGDWSQPTSWGTMTDISGNATATVFATANSIGGYFALLGPALFGYISDHYSWNVVFTVVAAFYVATAISWLLVRSDVPVFEPSHASNS